jgi:hypothetical protein
VVLRLEQGAVEVDLQCPTGDLIAEPSEIGGWLPRRDTVGEFGLDGRLGSAREHRGADKLQRMQQGEADSVGVKP